MERDLDYVVETTKGNLGRVIERGTHMELLKIKTEKLKTDTKRLRVSSQKYNFSAWKKKMKLYILGALLWAVLLFYAYSWVFT